MLNFWYSERCTRQIKLMICILTFALLYYCSSIEKLDPLFSAIALMIGMLTHALYQYRQRTQVQSKAAWLHGLGFIPLVILGLMIAAFPRLQQWILILQIFGFAAFGLFIVSIYANRSKRHN